MNNTRFFIIALLVLMTVGCSDSKVQLSGKVTFSDDGTPLEAGTICFTTETYAARGVLAQDGTYTASSVNPKDGLPPGKYRVYISGAHRVIERGPGEMPLYIPLIDTKYEDSETSGLELEVSAKTKTFDIQVDRYVGQ